MGKALVSAQAVRVTLAWRDVQLGQPVPFIQSCILACHFLAIPPSPALIEEIGPDVASVPVQSSCSYCTKHSQRLAMPKIEIYTSGLNWLMVAAERREESFR